MDAETTMGRGRSVTLRDVARAAGVSPATASRALHESSRSVTPELRERVVEAANHLRYFAPTASQAVPRGGSRTIALIVSDLEDPYFSSIAAGVIDAASRDGLRVTVDVTRRDPDRETAVIRSAEEQRSRALIFVGSRRGGQSSARLVSELTAFEGTGGRVVLVSQSGLPFDTVVPDNRSGAAALARALTQMGYSRFVVVAEPLEFTASTHRLEGFRAGVADAGVVIDDSDVLRGDDGWEGGHRLATGLIESGRLERREVELIFAVSDAMALGVLAALQEGGLNVPEDVAVAGYGGAVGPGRAPAQLTTVEFALRQIGTRAYELAIRDRPVGERAVATLPATVVIRASTPPLD